MTTKNVISMNDEAYNNALESHKTARATITSIQAELKALGYDQTSDWVKFNTYADVIQFIFEDKIKGYNLPPMSATKYLQLTEVDTARLEYLYTQLEDYRGSFEKPVAKDYVRVAKGKEQIDRLNMLKESANEFNSLISKGFIKASDVRVLSNGMFVLDRDNNSVVFNVHRF